MKHFRIYSVLFLSLCIIAEPPSDSDYAQHEPYFALRDAVNDTLGQPRMILCFMSKLRPDLMVSKAGQDYLALVDQAACDEAGQVSSGPQSQGGAASASSNSQSAAISYTEVVVNAQRSSNSDPMIVKAWVPNNDGGEDMTIYTYTEATAGISDSTPFGEFVMRYTGTTDSGQDFFKGYLQASGSSLLYKDEMVDPESGQTLNSRAVINLGEGDTGNGAVEGYIFDENGNITFRSDVFAYNEEVFCRQKVSQNGSDVSGNEKCFLTDESRGTKEVFGYFLYNSDTGARYDLPKKGFRVKYNGQYGFADGYGIHFDEETSNALTSGLTIVRDDDNPKLNGLEYSTYFLGGKLRKRVVSKKSLESFDGLSFLSYINNITDLGLSEPGEYKMYYSSDDESFVVTHKFACGDRGCSDQPLSSQVTFSLSTYLSNQSRYGIFGFMPGIGGVGISLDAMREPSSALVTSEIETDVSPADYPETLYCVENCPTYTNIQNMLSALSSGNQVAQNGPYENYNSFGANANSVVTYTLGSSGVYSAGDGDAVFGTNLSSSIKEAINQTQFSNGAYSGPLVSTLSDLTCEFEDYDYCNSSIQSGAVEIYYQWVTSHERWNQFRGLVDSTGRIVSFSRPENVYFNAPNNTNRFKEFAGKELRLEYAGGDQLWGIPGSCVDDGTFTDDCTDNDDDSRSGYLPWVDKFIIKPSLTNGRVYKNSGASGAYYLVKPAFGVVILKKNNSARGTLTLGSVDDLPDVDLINIGPNGGSNFVGASPSKPSTVSVVHGLSADEAASYQTDDSSSDQANPGSAPPVFTSESTFYLDENTTTVGTVAASDADGDVVLYSLSGFSSSGLDINATSGILSFISAPDYESKTTYTVDVVASDGQNSTTQTVTIYVRDVDDKAPIITSSRFLNFDTSSGSLVVATVTAVDADSDNSSLVFSVSSNSLSIDTSTGVISFNDTPTESEYTATVSVSDGTNTTSQSITVFVGGGSGGGGGGSGGGGGGSGGGGSGGGGSGGGGCANDDGGCPGGDTSLLFSGTAIDGYISGANVFIDQNFNFKFDQGEYFATTGNNGEFAITVANNSEYQCLSNRPAIADVPVGAIDSSLGEVTQAYKMVLPSINDTGSNAIVISPFTNLLSQTIIKAKNNSSIKEDLSLVQGCEAQGDEIASSISSEISQIMQTIQSSFGLSLNDIVSDFISGSSSNSIINESKAQRIASFLPYFKSIQDVIDADLSTKYNKTINTNLTLEEAAINTILSDNNFDMLPIDFYTVYKTEPNDSGWFTEESVRAKGAKLSSDGKIHHYRCITTEENCVTTNYSTSNIGDASEDYNNMTYFVNPNYSTSENVAFFVQDNRRWGEQTRDGQVVLEKDCVFTEQLDFSANNQTSPTLNTRMNSSVNNYDIQVDTCGGLSTGDKNLFTAKTYTYQTSTYYETSEMQYVNSSFDNAQYLKNKVANPYENRENIDLDAVITELKGLPYKYKDLNKARAYANDVVGDRVVLNFTIRDQNGTGLETHTIRAFENPEDDEYSKLERNSEGAYIETLTSKGQQARDDMFAALQASSGMSDLDFTGSDSVKDTRVSISGKTIDGYISGASVFVDVNFNQRKDAGEYSATTDANGVFELLVDESDLSCINARPIVADVPVGAVDSTLGVVTEAYQMILPSKNDAGSNAIVISPFTSLLTEAILQGKNEANLSQDLTVEEGCQSAGDAVAEKISSQVSSLISEIENTYGITWSALISDFIATNPDSGNITEEIAQKVAAFFPSYKKIKDDISTELSTRYAKDVTPNVSLSKDSLNAILSAGSFNDLPLEFFSVYQTNPNAQGFYNVDEISSTGATVSSDGSLKRYLCTLNNSSDCEINGLSLNGVANASKNYIRQVNINNDNFTVDGVVGNINIRGTDRRGVRNESTTPESYCESEETIQFVGPQDSKGLQMEYRYGYGRGVNNLKDCALLPNYGPTISLRIEKQGRGANFPNTAPTWAIQFGVNNQGTTRLTQSKIYNIIDNDDLDPAALIKEVALIPAALSKIDEMRKLLSYGEGASYYYSPNTSVDYDSGETFKSYNYRVSSVPRDDQFQFSEYHPDTGNVDGPMLEGQEARDAIFNIMSGSAYDYDNFIGNTAPKSNILFEFEGGSGAVFQDRLIENKNRDYHVYPRLDTSQGWIDASLVGSQISKASMDAFIGGDYTTQTKFSFGLNVDAPFTSVEDFNLKIYSNDQYSTSSEYLELNMQLKIETLSSGAVQVTWLDQGKVTFKIVDGNTTITKEVTNQRGDISRSIPKGNYNFNDFDFLKSLLDKVRDQFTSIELQILKDFFKNNGQYSFKIDLGNYAILDDYDQTSSIIAGTFGVSDNPINSVYSYYLPIIFGEGTNTDICFYTAWSAETDITFDIQPIYRNKPGFMTEDEVSFSTTNVTIDEGSNQKCVTFTSPVDDKLQERQEFIEFEIVNITGAAVGRNIPTRLTVQDD